MFFNLLVKSNDTEDKLNHLKNLLINTISIPFTIDDALSRDQINLSNTVLKSLLPLQINEKSQILVLLATFYHTSGKSKIMKNGQ